MIHRCPVFISTSEERLASLIQQRLADGADKERIDKRIWDLFGEEWCVMFTDLSGFSRNVAEFGIVHFLQTIYESERILLPVIEEHDGIVVKAEGDSELVIFRNVTKAVLGAIEMQRVAKAYNQSKPEEEHILLCLGLGFGPVLRLGDTDVFGAEVNAASKLGEDTAGAWEIMVTESVRENLEPLAGVSFEELPGAPPGAQKAFRLVYDL